MLSFIKLNEQKSVREPAAEREALLLIHGLCSSPQELRPLIMRIEAAGFEVHAPAAPSGYGMGPHPGGTLQRYEDWVQYFGGYFEDLISRRSRVSIGGLCMGANLALKLGARFRERVHSLVLVSTTLFYDGWNVPRSRILLPLAYYTPLRHWMKYRETHPYGVKNTRLRGWIAAKMRATGASTAGAAHLPMTAIYQGQRLIHSVKRNLSKIVAPTLIMHAREDDVSSLRSADLVCSRISSHEVVKRVFDNSYHMLTLDNDRDAVAQAAVDFLSGSRRRVSAVTDLPADANRGGRCFA
jgi:carboxylesterase